MVTSMVTKDGAWDDKEIVDLKAYRLKGFSITEIAKFLGRSPQGVQRKIAYLTAAGPVPELKPMKVGGEEHVSKKNAMACTLHLIDLMRSFRGKTLGQAKAVYAKRHEYEINNGGIIAHDRYGDGNDDLDYDFS